MPKQREQVAMTPAEVAAFLAAHRKVQLATLNRDGSVHLTTMFYGLQDGRIAFWTYRSAQKAVNLARDPRVTCLVEAGDAYFDLRGVQIQGVARPVSSPEGVLAIGRLIVTGMGGDVPRDTVEDYVAHTARKRIGFTVTPRRVISWDHSKLMSLLHYFIPERQQHGRDLSAARDGLPPRRGRDAAAFGPPSLKKAASGILAARRP